MNDEIVINGEIYKIRSNMKLEFKEGIHNISSDDYHNSSGFSRSQLMDFKRSPLHFYKNHIDNLGSTKETTEAMIFGELVHTLVLEPHLYEDRFSIKPQVDRRTKDGKFKYCQFESTLCGKVAISQDYYDMAWQIADNVIKDDSIHSLLQLCDMERSIYFKHKETGILCKARPDAWYNDVVIDLKTSADCSYRGIQSSAYKYSYFLQAGMIAEALDSVHVRMDKFIILAVEKTFPFLNAVYFMHEDCIQYGRDQFNGIMRDLAVCLDKDVWPGYAAKELSLPAYAENNYSVFDDEDLENE